MELLVGEVRLPCSDRDEVTVMGYIRRGETMKEGEMRAIECPLPKPT